MSISHLLEDFGIYRNSNPEDVAEVLLEEERLEAFEKGYQAGWDDSARAQRDGAHHVSAELAQNLKDLTCTYHEALSGMLSGLRPLIEQMIAAVLPQLAGATLGVRVADLLQELVARHGRQPVRIFAAPANLAVLETLIRGNDTLPMEIAADDTLEDGQVRIGFGSVAEREIDIDEVLRGIDAAVAAYFETDMTEQKDVA